MADTIDAPRERPSRIRRARVEDAARLAAFSEQTFRDTFGESNTAADMDDHCRRFFGVETIAREIERPDMETLIVEAEGDPQPKPEPLAYAQLRRGPAPPCVRARDPIELQRIYVRRSRHGSGLAAELMTAVLDRAAAAGADVLWLGVWERNPRAIRFYGKLGFREVGDQVFVLGSDPQRDLVMALPLLTPPPGSPREAKS
jgi:ribosomal protein S18 acetylase RimI-like enzyme